MKRLILTAVAVLFWFLGYSQVMPTDTSTNEPMNSVQNILSGNSGKRVTLGAYAQIDYNQPLSDSLRSNGKMDVHRLVMFMGYKFNDKAQFVTEVEFEHVKEVYVEQAFLNYSLNRFMNFRAGLLLIPMGIINEYHEPPTYNGVERPALDHDIVPTTWREMGAGFQGRIMPLSLKYQLYAVNGFLGYDGDGLLRGNDAFRKGRQKGAKAVVSAPNFTGKVDYYGIGGLKLGLSGYYGNTQSTMYNGIHNSNDLLKKTADSTYVGIAMVGMDVRYNYKAFQARGQLNYSDISNTEAYNEFTGKDLGSSLFGYYAEVGYDVLSCFNKDIDEELIAAFRYEFFDTHNSFYNDDFRNEVYARTIYTFALGYKVAPGAVFKADFQLAGDDTQMDILKYNKQVNFGVGVWF